MSSPLTRYQENVESGAFDADPLQERAVFKLDRLHHVLKTYCPGGRQGLLELLKLRPKKQSKHVPAGIYLYGGVGRGKSMLMDLFFDLAPPSQKRRVHFHSFMLEVHDFMHQRRHNRKQEDRIDADLIAFADKIAAESWLLCFDEFHVDDVADAMILGRLFTALFDRGVVVVATSNVAPVDLYKDGLQRDRFEPFIELLEQRMEIVHFYGDRDYRLDRVRDMDVYYCPADADATQQLDKAFQELTDGTEPRDFQIKVRGRIIDIPAAAKCVARFTFADLCEQPRAAADYIEIASRFHTIFVEGVPAMNDNQRNEVLRFVTLIDVLYEHRRKLFISAAVQPEDLYTGVQHKRAFDRTASRLMEMQAKDYLGDFNVA